MNKKYIIIVMLLSMLFSTTAYGSTIKTPSGIKQEDLGEFIDNYVDDYIGKTVAGANIIVLKDNNIIFSKGYGYADVENEIRMDPKTTVTEWGSVSKLFVWTSVMQLAEQGKIDLNEDIRNYLPEGFLTKLKYDEPITMLNLMHHNAGFEENIFDLGFTTKEQVKPLEEGLKIAEPAQVYKPGEVVAYSNYSTSLAAYVVECVTGEEYYNYVTNNVLFKLNMQQTIAHESVSQNKDLLLNKATGYKQVGEEQLEPSDPWYMSLYPSGGINGTAEDLAKFTMGLMPNKGGQSPLFISNTTLNEMLSQSYTANDNVPGIAHGFWEYDGAYRGLTHSGNTASYSTNFHIVPEENFAVVILTNQAGETNICEGLMAELVGDKDVNIESNLPDSKVLEGTYISARRMINNMMKFYYYVIPFKVESMSTNEIKINFAGMTAEYTQTSPYVYRFTSGNPVFNGIKTMYFHVNNDKVEQISMPFMDYLPMPLSSTVLLINFILAIFSSVYFLLTPIVLIIRSIIRRRKKLPVSPFSIWSSVMSLSGTAIVINLIIFILRMLANSSRSYSEVLVHVVLNFVFTAIGIIGATISVSKWKKVNLSKLQKVFYIVSCITFTCLIILLLNWKFYS